MNYVDPVAEWEARQRALVQSTMPVQAAPTKKKPNFIQSLFPSGGGLAGGLAGAAAGTAILPGVGTLIGALLGGGAGGAYGKAVQNASTGESLGHDVLREGITQGVLSAGPLRLLKAGAAGGRALIAGGEALGSGGRLATALAASGKAATAPSIVKTAIAKKLGSAGENLASKSLGLTSLEKNNILEKTGERAGALAKKYGISSSDDIAKATKPLYDEFNAAVGSIPKVFSKREVAGAFKSVYEPMLAKGVPTGTQAIGKSLKQEADNLLQGIGREGINAAELNARRQAFDKLAYKFKSDPSLYDINKLSRNAVSDLIHSAADEAGVVTQSGKTLKEVGQEINKLERLGKAAKKHVESGGKSIVSLGSTPGAVVGGSAGGLPGAVIGMASNQAINSAPVRKALAFGTERLAERATSSAARSAAQPFGVGIAKRVGIPGLAGALLGQSSIMAPKMPTAINPSDVNINTANNDIGSTYASNADGSIPTETNDSPFAIQNVEANIQRMIQGGAKTKDVMDYVSLVEALQGLQPKPPKPLNSTAAGTVTDLQNGITNIRALGDEIANSNVNSPILGGLRGKNPWDTGAQTLQANIARVKQVIGKALEGGVLRKEDEVKYAKILPTLNDTDATAQAKIQMIADDLDRKLYLYQQNLGGGGGGDFALAQ